MRLGESLQDLSTVTMREYQNDTTIVVLQTVVRLLALLLRFRARYSFNAQYSSQVGHRILAAGFVYFIE
jgi:hypothetical protein